MTCHGAFVHLATKKLEKICSVQNEIATFAIVMMTTTSEHINIGCTADLLTGAQNVCNALIISHLAPTPIE